MFANQYWWLQNMRLVLLLFIDYQLNIIVKSCCLVLLLWQLPQYICSVYNLREWLVVDFIK